MAEELITIVHRPARPWKGWIRRAILAIVFAAVVLLAWRAGRDPAQARAIAHSLGIALVAVPVGTVLGSAVALAAPRGPQRGRILWIAALLALPLLPAGILRGLGAMGGAAPGIPAVMAAHTLLCALTAGIVLRIRLNQIDPALEEAAADLGAGPIEILRRVIAPLAWRAGIAGALLSVAVSLSEGVVSSLVAPPGWDLIGPRTWAQLMARQGGSMAWLLAAADLGLILLADATWRGGFEAGGDDADQRRRSRGANASRTAA